MKLWGWISVAIVMAACGGSAPAPAAPPANTAPPARPAAVEAPVAAPPEAQAGPALDSPTHSIAEATERMGQFRDAMCKCTEKTCADQLMDMLTRWGQEMARQGDQARATAAETQQMAKVVEALTTCMTTAMRAGASTGAPATSTPAKP